MKRVCFYGVSTQLGGAERSLLELVSGLNSSKHYEPWLVLPHDRGPLVDELQRRNIPIEILKFPDDLLEMSRSRPLRALTQGVAALKPGASYIRELVKIFKRGEPALIHTTGVKCHLLGAMAARTSGIPVLWHLRDIFQPGPTRIMLRTAAAMYNPHLVANSLATARAFDPSREIPVIYNGLDPKGFFPNQKKKFQRLLGLDENTPIIGIAGVLARWKGQVEFLRMARLLLDEGLEAGFAVIGGEIYDTVGERGFTEELYHLAETLNLTKHVVFAGFQKDMAAEINALDVLVHASIRPEPFGRVAVEGMACGVPVVASDEGGIREIIEHEKTGLLFKSHEPSIMAEQVRRALKDQLLRERLINAGRQKFLDRFTQERHVQEMIKLFDSVIS